MERELEELRQEIDEIDDKIIHLLGQRKEVSKLVGALKKKLEKDIVDELRENQLLERVQKKAAEHNVDANFIKDMYQKILENSRKEQE